MTVLPTVCVMGDSRNTLVHHVVEGGPGVRWRHSNDPVPRARVIVSGSLEVCSDPSRRTRIGTVLPEPAGLAAAVHASRGEVPDAIEASCGAAT